MHSIAAALFAGTDRIHFFREIGYTHHPFMHCPAEPEIWEKGRCACNPVHNFGKCQIIKPDSCLSFADALYSIFDLDYHSYSCLNRWDRLFRVDP